MSELRVDTIKDEEGTGSPSFPNGATIAYDNTASGLVATNIKGAVDELQGGKVAQTDTTGSAEIPSGTQAQRDAAPSAGFFRFNTDTSQFEGYNGTEWGEIGGGGSANGASEVFSFSATVTGSTGASDWTGSDPYIATITVSGILSTDTPVVDLDMSNVAFADVPDVVGEFGLVYRIEASADDEIKLYATAEPTQDFDLTIQVIR